MADGKVIKVQRIPAPELKPADALDRLAEFCYYYPAYTIAQARRLPEIHVRRMLNKVRKLRAAHYYNLTRIASAPHTDKGKGVTDLLTEYRKDMNV